MLLGVTLHAYDDLYNFFRSYGTDVLSSFLFTPVCKVWCLDGVTAPYE